MNVLLVDDDCSILKGVEKVLSNEGYHVACAGSGLNALAEMERKNFDLVITDMLMPNMNGIELLGKIKQSFPKIQVLFMTAFGSIENAVEAMRMGAYGYLIKPIDVRQTLLEINKIKELMQLKEQNHYLVQEVGGGREGQRIVGNDPKMIEILEISKRVAISNSTILIGGETGTGKELIASYIHSQSPRKEKPFIKVNCCALSEGVLESELFGHERGAFTGAIKDRKGRFELADSGTIFLDEIGDLSSSLQVKLLRFLQEREFERVGGSRTIRVDVRVVAATNKDLEKEVKKSNFRSDLYYRLNVINICLPKLKKRLGDVPAIANYFLHKYAVEMGKPDIVFTEEAMDIMMKYDWPGNVRELDNVVERGVVLCTTDEIGINDLPFKVPKESAARERGDGKSFKEAVKMFEKEFIEESLRANEYNISRTAEIIKLARTNIYEKIKKYGIAVPRER